MSPEAANNEKIKVTLYYFADAIKGLGHVACTISGGGGPLLYISPMSVGWYFGKYAPKNYGETYDLYFNEEIKFFKTHNILKIELPESEMNHQEFIKRFWEAAEEYNKTGYSVATNSCAHLSSIVLNTVYSKIPSRKGSLALLPSTVAKDACRFLESRSLFAAKTHAYINFLKGLYKPDKNNLFREISYVSTYQTVKDTINQSLI